MLSAIRNNFGFHYPETADAEAAFLVAADDLDFDDMWKVYFSQHKPSSSAEDAEGLGGDGTR